MVLFRSAFNGIGSGAGVAWPLFGLVFSLVGGPIGSCLSLGLGIVCILLFLTISLAICYFSYKEKTKQQQQFSEKFQKNQCKLLSKIALYLEIIANQTRQNISPNERLDRDLHQASQDGKGTPLYQILSIIKKEYPQQEERMDNKKTMEHIATLEDMKLKPSKLQGIVTAMTGFVSTFGSVAGCSAGVSGLLTGLGLFSSFAAFPLLGWGILGTALLCGFLMAVEATSSLQEEFQLNALNNKIRKMRHQLSKTIFKHQVDSTVFSKLSTLNSPQEEKKLFCLLNKPIISLVHTKNKSQDIQETPIDSLSFS